MWNLMWVVLTNRPIPTAILISTHKQMPESINRNIGKNSRYLKGNFTSSELPRIVLVPFQSPWRNVSSDLFQRA